MEVAGRQPLKSVTPCPTDLDRFQPHLVNRPRSSVLLSQAPLSLCTVMSAALQQFYKRSNNQQARARHVRVVSSSNLALVLSPKIQNPNFTCSWTLDSFHLPQSLHISNPGLPASTPPTSNTRATRPHPDRNQLHPFLFS